MNERPTTGLDARSENEESTVTNLLRVPVTLTHPGFGAPVELLVDIDPDDAGIRPEDGVDDLNDYVREVVDDGLVYKFGAAVWVSIHEVFEDD